MHQILGLILAAAACLAGSKGGCSKQADEDMFPKENSWRRKEMSCNNVCGFRKYLPVKGKAQFKADGKGAISSCRPLLL